jgi:hypothetical protein
LLLSITVIVEVGGACALVIEQELEELQVIVAPVSLSVTVNGALPPLQVMVVFVPSLVACRFLIL